MSETQPSALKEWFDAARFRRIAKDVHAIESRFDEKRFLKHGLDGLDDLSLMQRLRRMTESLRIALPFSYRKNLDVLRKLAPKIDHGFVTLVLPDYVAIYGLEHFDLSMEALKFFTPFGSSEFAVRHFLKADFSRALRKMEEWSRDSDPAVRRLASEGARPRLPWSFRLEELIADPSPVAPILENLKTDNSLYVRKSVANHLNDITKDHPDWVLSRLGTWDLANVHSAWIAKRALRSLIKKGNRRALTVIGAGQKAQVRVEQFSLSPRIVKLGERIVLSFELQSLSKRLQRLVVDYVVHYVKKSGANSAKVFKLKEVSLTPGEKIRIRRSQLIHDFTTRTHHAGLHKVEVMVNGDKVAEGAFELRK